MRSIKIMKFINNFLKDERAVVGMVFSLLTPVVGGLFYLGIDGVNLVTKQIRLDDAIREANMSISMQTDLETRNKIANQYISKYIQVYSPNSKYEDLSQIEDAKGSNKALSAVTIAAKIMPIFEGMASKNGDFQGQVVSTSLIDSDPYRFAGNSDYAFAIDFSSSMGVNRNEGGVEIEDDIFTKNELAKLCKDGDPEFKDEICGLQSVTKLAVAQAVTKHILKILAINKQDSVKYALVPFSYAIQADRSVSTALNSDAAHKGSYTFITPFILKEEYRLESMAKYNELTHSVKYWEGGGEVDKDNKPKADGYSWPEFNINTVDVESQKYVCDMEAVFDKGIPYCRQVRQLGGYSLFQKGREGDEEAANFDRLLKVFYQEFAVYKRPGKNSRGWLNRDLTYPARAAILFGGYGADRKYRPSKYKNFTGLFSSFDHLAKVVDVEETLNNLDSASALQSTFGFNLCSKTDKDTCQPRYKGWRGREEPGFVWKPYGFGYAGRNNMDVVYSLKDENKVPDFVASESPLKSLNSISTRQADPINDEIDKQTLTTNKTDDLKDRSVGLLRAAAHLANGKNKRKVLVLITDGKYITTPFTSTGYSWLPPIPMEANNAPGNLEGSFLKAGLCSKISSALKKRGAQEVDIITIIIGKKSQDQGMLSAFQQCGGKENVVFVENIKEFVDNYVTKTLKKQKPIYIYADATESRQK